MTEPPNRLPLPELVDIVRWYAEIGVDIALDETPHDRLAEGAREAQKRAAAAVVEAPTDQAVGTVHRPAPSRPSGADRADQVPSPAFGEPSAPLRRAPGPAMALSADQAVVSAREQARSAASLDDLRRLLEGFDGCSLKATATRLVFADGNPQARVMFVGEAPGAEEDRQGLPFVGRAGQLLDRMLSAIALDRTTAYIANVVPWRPPGNRTPTPQETAICLPFTLRQIELANPDILVCLGGASAQTLLGLKDGIMRARGRWHAYELGGEPGARTIKAMATLHPAYLLRQPAHKRFAWRDLRLIRRELDKQAASRAPA